MYAVHIDQVGAVVVDKDGTVIGESYNYLPKEGLPIEREAEKEEDTKYPYSKKMYIQTHTHHKTQHTVTHAAVDAIQNAYKAKGDPSGGTIYTNMFPSSRDAVVILRAEIKQVVFLEKNRQWRKRYHTGATKKLFDGDITCK